jgi:hypothetical protein
MNKGWFAQRGIKPGAKLRGLESSRPASVSWRWWMSG